MRSPARTAPAVFPNGDRVTGKRAQGHETAGVIDRLPGRRPSVFLNVPYDSAFRELYLAYIAGVSSFSLVPRATLEIPGGERRLDRILSLIRSCPYSLHDLSRVELDRHSPRTPRFNMPFELGLAVAWQKPRPREHTWFVFEAMPRRAEKSISDLSGTDIYVHQGTVRGVFTQLCNAFVRLKSQPAAPEMEETYLRLKELLPKLQKQTGAQSPFEARIFRDLVVAARELTRRQDFSPKA
jgi:hypothetical protein